MVLALVQLVPSKTYEKSFYDANTQKGETVELLTTKKIAKAVPKDATTYGWQLKIFRATSYCR